MFGRLVTIISLLALLTLPASAQSQDPSGASSSGANATPSSNPSANPSTEKKKPKKVWTNEEIGSVPGTVSVVGDAKPSTAQNSKTGKAVLANAVRQRQIENYRSQIRQFESQIEAIDKRIAQFKSFKAENTSPSGGIDPRQGYTMLPPEEQVKQLEEKKKQLQTKIENVENDARKNGIEPGELR
jgi:archaellum component FlaC